MVRTSGAITEAEKPVADGQLVAVVVGAVRRQRRLGVETAERQWGLSCGCSTGYPRLAGGPHYRGDPTAQVGDDHLPIAIQVNTKSEHTKDFQLGGLLSPAAP